MNRFILIGLGNPGKKYENTRHNAGKMLVRWMKEEGRRKREEGKLELIESESFMNESGRWVKSQLPKMVKMVKMAQMAKDGNHPNTLNPLNNLYHLFIIHDDLDIPLGKFKIQFGKGPRLHKGILSVEQALGTKEFWRVRIGTDNRKNQMATMAKNGYNGSDYVLSNFKRAERKILETDVFPKIGEELESIINRNNLIRRINE